MKTSSKLILLTCLCNSSLLFAKPNSQIKTVDKHPIHVTEWSDAVKDDKRPQVLMLSGPTDNWNSDSAWFSRMAPKLAKDYRVVTIDRAGQLLATKDAPVGYAHFGDDLVKLLPQINLNKPHIIAFASANLALHQYFSHQDQSESVAVQSITMIDPDVLTEFSIQRYSKDAKPFKDNLQKYLAYIGEGKYNQRAAQKNQLERDHLKTLNAEDANTDWDYFEQVLDRRLKLVNLQNTFREIAIYKNDLTNALKTPLPKDIPLLVIDTDFEQIYIDKEEDPKDKTGLIQWKKDAAAYYKLLAKTANRGEYLYLVTREHLLPFSDPDLLIKHLKTLTK